MGPELTAKGCCLMLCGNPQEDAIPELDSEVPHSYVIKSGSQEHEVVGREEAIDRAKELSQRFYGNVVVQRDDERMSMIYRRGSLQKYHFETRR